MRRSLGFQQQYYADGGMWMQTQAQRQSHAFYEESWSSDNNYHKQLQLPGMHMELKPGGAFAMESQLSMSKHRHGNGKLGGSYGMFQESMHCGSGHCSGKKFPFGGTTTNPPHQFSKGGVRFNHGGHHDYVSKEEYEYEAYNEEHHGAVTEKVDEKRHQHRNWGGDSFYANPHEGYKNRKPRGGHRVEWTANGSNTGPAYTSRISTFEFILKR